MDQNETLPSPMDLPPLEKELEKGTNAVTQQGSERNPEFLPPVLTGATAARPDPTQQPVPEPPTAPPAEPTTSHDQAGAPSASLAQGSPQIADDTDLIEKEWVEKAKEIVAKTKENPYLQNKAISEIKADYIKKRYNKDIAKSKE